MEPLKRRHSTQVSRHLHAGHFKAVVLVGVRQENDYASVGRSAPSASLSLA
jgi:hypothetical protein